MSEWVGEPSRQEIEHGFPEWETYRGVADWWFARRRDNPDVKVRGEDLADLRDAIQRAEALSR